MHNICANKSQKKKKLRFFVASLILLTTQINAFAKNVTIEWEIVGRFRLIKDAVSETRLFDLAKLAPHLQCAVDARNSCGKNDYLNVLSEFEKKAPKGNIGFKTMPVTFYNPISGKYDEEYVKKPRHWKIKFKIADEDAGSKKCNWHLDDVAINGEGNCQNFQFKTSLSAGQTVRVETNDGLTGTVTVNAKDILVVGMGDSYASGEGMPDVPAVTGIAPAQWLDEKCHRSLLSAQSLTAARIAAENKHQSVTFISRACSGAIIADLIDLPLNHLPEPNYKRQGAISGLCHGGSHNTDCTSEESKILPSQLDAINADLKIKNEPKRQPNLVLLSIGGNDLGFMHSIIDLIMKEITNKSEDPKKKFDLKDSYTAIAEIKRQKFWDNYPLLVAKLTSKYTGFPDATFVHTGYPNPLMRDGAVNKFCLADGNAKEGKFYQITEQQGLIGDTVDFFVNRAKIKGDQDEYIALHNDYLVPLTGDVRCLANISKDENCKADLPHKFGMRGAMIAGSCAVKHKRRDMLQNSEGLQAMYEDASCNDFKRGNFGFSKDSDQFTDDTKWRFSFARNENHYNAQLAGFVVNGFCISDAKKGVQSRWFNVLGDALTNMSSASDFLLGYAASAHKGTAHPNIYGQLFLAERTWVAIPSKFKSNN